MIINHKSYSSSILSITPNEDIYIIINNNCYNLYYNINYNIYCNDRNLEIEILSIFNDKHNPLLEYFKIFDYENFNNQIAEKKFYEIVYSFDKNYIQGAFASIYSLLFNSNFNENIKINIITEKNDYFEIINYLLKFIYNYKIKNYFSFTLIDINILDNIILNTKCYKGGNHLLKLSNFTRLLIGHFFNYNYVLYLDSDTIVQTDITKVLDKFELINDNETAIWGKKSELEYKNILNMNNYNKFKNSLSYLNITNNIIYTGTLIIKPILLKNKYKDIISLIKLHNEIEDGLYKLFTMSIINIVFYNQIKYFDDFLNNVVDLGHKKDIKFIENAHVLDWSGIYKPWFLNGYYRNYWLKYDVINKNYSEIYNNKNTIEKFIS